VPPILRNGKYSPTMSHPYIITKTGDQPWSEPTFIHINPDYRSLRKAEEALRKSNPVNERFDMVEMIYKVDDYSTVRVPVVRERTCVRLCMPSGVIFAAWNT
jgi:hypothetical protein